jgi:hypothetical protein
MPTLAREPYDPNPDPASLGSAGKVPNTTVTTQGASDFPARPQFRRRGVSNRLFFDDQVSALFPAPTLDLSEWQLRLCTRNEISM